MPQNFVWRFRLSQAVSRRCARAVEVSQLVERIEWETYQQDYDHPHEDLLQVPKILNTLQQGCCAAEERILACLLNCTRTGSLSLLSLSAV